MGDKRAWMIYGANGYSGRLVAQEAKRQGLSPILAGRNAAAVEALATEVALPWRAFDLSDAASTRSSLVEVAVVANCAGPFAETAAPMIDACLRVRAHYVDITGEIDVFLAAEARHDKAKTAGVVVCPGVGFDVIPTDCVAACLRDALPDASRLALGFKGHPSRSPGTARTAIDALAVGGRVREHGAIITEPLGHRTRTIDFGTGPKFAVAIPWGDVATAYFTTGIPNVEVFVPASKRSVARLRRLNWMRPLMRVAPIRSLMKRAASRGNVGPTQKQRDTEKTWIWGEARNERGDVRIARLTTTNGYRLTVDGVLMAVRSLLARVHEGGYYTPVMLLGQRCVERLPGSSAIRIE
jgi:short subunit dehydrogenase-like uncharacterized protein